ncbi:MAG: hypothetical protein LBL75_00170 [Rickettsiales bacterium]|jgi:hypothetical protein|nr:hypothetical protein [Rickettsiales bacterium]
MSKDENKYIKNQNRNIIVLIGGVVLTIALFCLVIARIAANDKKSSGVAQPTHWLVTNKVFFANAYNLEILPLEEFMKLATGVPNFNYPKFYYENAMWRTLVGSDTAIAELLSQGDMIQIQNGKIMGATIGYNNIAVGALHEGYDAYHAILDSLGMRGQYILDSDSTGFVLNEIAKGHQYHYNKNNQTYDQNKTDEQIVKGLRTQVRAREKNLHRARSHTKSK